MQPIDLGDDFFKEMGLDNASEEKKKQFLHHVIETLQMRVGEELTLSLTEDQAEEFDKLDESDPHAAWMWLEHHCPQYKTVVADELRALKQELLGRMERILRAQAQ